MRREGRIRTLENFLLNELVLGVDGKEVVCGHNYSIGHCFFEFLVEHNEAFKMMFIV